MLDWSAKLAAANDKQIVLGLEPTGHYWFCLTTWLVARDQCCAGESIRSKTDKRGGRQQPA